MKTLLFVVAAGLLFALSAQSVDNALSVANFRTNPGTIVAGQNVTLTFLLYNSYSQNLQNVNLELEGSYPILNYSPAQSYLIGSVGEGLYGGINNYFTYTLQIPKDVPSGFYTVDLVGTYQATETGSQTYVVSAQSVIPLSFYVNGAPYLSIASTPSVISPQSQFSMGLSIVNTGYGNAYNLTLEFENTTKFKVDGAKDLSLGTLPQSTPVSASENYEASSNLTNGTYSIPIIAKYKSSTGEWHNQTLYANVSVVVDNPNLVVSLTGGSPQSFYQGYNQSLQFTVENIGNGEAKNISIYLNGNGINFLSSLNPFFIGSISPGDEVSKSVLISANSTYNGTIYANMAYYASNYGQRFDKTQYLKLNLAPAAQFTVSAGSYSLNPGSTNKYISIKITNMGTVEARGIQLDMQSIYPITPIQSSYYIPSLLPGQSTNATFMVSVDQQGVSGTYPITLFEQWKQPNGAINQLYSGSSSYYVVVGANNGNYDGYAIIVVIIIIAAAVVRIRRKGAKKKIKK